MIDVLKVGHSGSNHLLKGSVGLFGKSFVNCSITCPCQHEVAVDILLLYQLFDGVDLGSLKIGNLNRRSSAIFLDVLGHIEVHIGL